VSGRPGERLDLISRAQLAASAHGAESRVLAGSAAGAAAHPPLESRVKRCSPKIAGRPASSSRTRLFAGAALPPRPDKKTSCCGLLRVCAACRARRSSFCPAIDGRDQAGRLNKASGVRE